MKVNNLRISLAVLVLCLLAMVPASAQTSGSADKNYADWKKIELGDLTFYAPKDLTKVQVKCVDSGCDRFESSSFILNIDSSPGGLSDADEKLPSYRQEKIWIDESKGIWAYIWSMEKVDSKYRYYIGATYVFEKTKGRLIGIRILSENTDIRSIGEKILRSVEFKEPSGMREKTT